MPIEYATSASAVPLHFVKNEMDEVTHVRSNRTNLIDDIVNDIRYKRIQFTGYGHHKLLIQEQLRDMVRVEEPKVPAKWVKLRGNDHFLHALGYARHALRIHDVIHSQQEHDPRQIASLFPIVSTVQQSDAQLGVRDRRKTPYALGLI